MYYPEDGVSLEVNLKRLAYFATLQDNWNGYEAVPISQKVLKAVEDLVKLADIQPEIFPLASGGIQCEWDNDEVHIVIEVIDAEKWIIAWQPADCDGMPELEIPNIPQSAMDAVHKILAQHFDI